MEHHHFASYNEIINTKDTKGTFHAKMGLIKDRNGMNLTEAEEVARIHRRTVQTLDFSLQNV